MLRPSLFQAFVATYALLYAGFGVQSPFVPALLRERGLQPQDIGVVLAGAMVIRVIAGPFVGHVAISCIDIRGSCVAALCSPLWRPSPFC